MFTGRYLLVPALHRAAAERRHRAAALHPPQRHFSAACPDPLYIARPGRPDEHRASLLKPPSITAARRRARGPGGRRRPASASPSGSATPASTSTSRRSTSRATRRSSSATSNWGGNANPVRGRTRRTTRSTSTPTRATPSTRRSIVGLNGTIQGGHILTASVTFADKKNITDDFSPEFPNGYPSDPADIEAEWGRARGDEELPHGALRRLPAAVGAHLAPISSTARASPGPACCGYDYNGDGKQLRPRRGRRPQRRGRPELQPVRTCASPRPSSSATEPSSS